MEVLKVNRIPFKAKVRILDREVDFLIRDKIIVEINGHEQDLERNNAFVLAGYIPIHISNQELITNRNQVIYKINAYKDKHW